MPDYFENFCREHGINPLPGNQAALDKLADVCFRIISTDRCYHQVEEYIQLIEEYSVKFLPYVPSQLHKIVVQFKGRWNTIQWAAYHGYDKYLSLLEDVSVDLINKGDEYGMTPLHLAALQGHIQMVNLLLARGADVHQQNNIGELALFCALGDPDDLKAKKEAVFRCLWAHDRETIKHVNDIQETVVHNMAVYGYDDLLSEAIDYDKTLVLNKNHRGDAPIHGAILNGQLDAVNLILSLVPEAAALDGNKSRNLIHYAVISGNPSIVESCCKAIPEKIDALDSEGVTPWMLAAHAKNQAVMSVLKAFGADETIHADRGTTFGLS